ncbi:MAG: hypothetical protein KDD25_03460, partial [Bdellovibrionales bacterium]|nr:hypothetical protein [Bdellovibrionales bacterium]
NRLYFKKSFYLKLSEMDRAALYFHEVAYKIARDWGATNSDQVRKFVAQSFSDSKVDTQITPRGENDFMRGNLFLGCTDFSGLYRSICYSNGDVVSSSVMSIEQDSCDELSFGNDLWVIGFKTINRTEGPDFTIQRELTPRWSANKRELYLDMSWSKTVGKETEVIHGVGVLKSTFFGLTNSSNWGNGPIDCRFTHLDL